VRLRLLQVGDAAIDNELEVRQVSLELVDEFDLRCSRYSTTRLRCSTARLRYSVHSRTHLVDEVVLERRYLAILRSLCKSVFVLLYH
jgi:hypothetical protein